eukprot:4416113-Amphidinium_carterae.1
MATSQGTSRGTLELPLAMGMQFMCKAKRLSNPTHVSCKLQDELLRDGAPSVSHNSQFKAQP